MRKTPPRGRRLICDDDSDSIRAAARLTKLETSSKAGIRSWWINWILAPTKRSRVGVIGRRWSVMIETLLPGGCIPLQPHTNSSESQYGSLKLIFSLCKMSQWNTTCNFEYVRTVWALCSYSSGSMCAHIQAWLQRTDNVLNNALNKCKHDITVSLFLLPPGGQKAGSRAKFFVFFRYLIMMIFCSQILTSAEWITGDVITCVETQSAALSAAARKATSYWPMRGLVKVGSPIEYCLPHRSNKVPFASNTFWLVEGHFCFV